MNNLQRIGGGAVQIWGALPIWARVVAVVGGLFALYYGAAILIGLVFLAALGIGAVQILRWLLTK